MNNSKIPSLRQTLFVTAHWGGGAIIPLVSGHYGVALAFKWGYMGKIFNLAMLIIEKHWGTLAIGVFMPYVCWYATLLVRITCTLMSYILYRIAEKTALFAIETLEKKLFPKPSFSL